MMKITLTGDWRALQRLSSHRMNMMLIDSLNDVLSDTSKQVSKEQSDKILSGTLAANAPMTVAMKGRNSPLIDTGNLLKSIKSSKVGDSYMAGPTGFNKNAGKSNEDLAAQHEIGGFSVINNRVVELPARPFARKPVDNAVDELPEKVVKALKETVERELL